LPQDKLRRMSPAEREKYLARKEKLQQKRASRKHVKVVR
jgi:hypothetical protein